MPATIARALQHGGVNAAVEEYCDSWMAELQGNVMTVAPARRDMRMATLQQSSSVPE
jgi:hypothetical protein